MTTQQALEIWNAMTVSERAEIMGKVTYVRSQSKFFKNIIKYIIER